MAKSAFLIRFQKNLRDSLEELICSKWQFTEIEVKEEDGDINGIFNGYMDISLTNRNNQYSVVGIEIEHKSNSDQAMKNIEKLKKWTHNSPYRSSSLLHIFNEGSNIYHEQIEAMVKYAKGSEHKNHGFYYDFVFYRIDDHKMTKRIATDLVDSREFRARLWNMIDSCGLIK